MSTSKKFHLLLTFLCLCMMLFVSACTTSSASGTGNAGTPTTMGSTDAPGATATTGGTSASTPNATPTTDCPASGSARPAIMPVLQLGHDQNIIYVDNLTAIIRRHDIQTGADITILDQPGAVGSPQLSTDGQWILYTLVAQNTYAIQLIRVDGQDQQTLYCAPASSTIGDKTNVQWSPDQKLVIFAQTNLNDNIISLHLLNLLTGSAQVELTPSNANVIYQPRTWVDNTRVYVTTDGSVDGIPTTLQILDTAKGSNQPQSSLQQVVGVGDTEWDFDSTYDGSKLFVVHADPTPGRSGPGTYCQISASTTSGQNGNLIFKSSTLVPGQLRVAGSGSSTLLLSINNPGDPADKYNGLWKVNADGTGLVELTNQPNTLNAFSQYPWSNVSRDNQLYSYGTSYGLLSGGALTSYTTEAAFVVGWTTM